jgi:Tol biopolymer transport system component
MDSTRDIRQLSFALSPDGQQLAALATMGKRSSRGVTVRRILTMPAKGGEFRELWKTEGRVTRPMIAWTPDGQSLLFTKQSPERGRELWLIPAGGGQARKLCGPQEMMCQGMMFGVVHSALDMHPDGQRIAFDCFEYRHEVWAMENFLPAAPVAKTASQITLRQIWSGPDADAYGGPSADGRYLSHTDWKTGDLAIRELATGKTRILTETKKGGREKFFRFALNSVISPDGMLIAYSWTNQYGTYDLCVIAADGSGDRTLYSRKDHEIYPASWSSDGKRIAARRYTSNMEIVSVLVADGSVQVLKTSEQFFWPQFCYSPDDRFIACDFPVAENAENYDISLIRADGSGEIPLVTHPANDRLLGWVPSRDEVLFRSNRSGTHDIWAVRVVDGKVQDSPRPVTRDVGEISPQGFTRDGSFYFSRYKRRFTSQTIPLNERTGEVQEQLAKPLLGSNYSPAWSPDGRYLAYVQEQTATAGPGWYHRPLHIRDVKTGEERTLAEEFGLRSPRWSPDGRSLLVIGKERKKDYNGGVYTIDVQDGRVTELVQFPPVEKWSRDIWSRSIAEWAHDGKAIFYTSRGKIIRRQIKSGQETQLYQSDNLTRALDVSPDGKTLVFGNGLSGEGQGQVMSMSVSGGQPTELCRFQEPKGGLKTPRQLAWTPDGNYVLFAKKEEKGATVRRVSSSGGEPEVIGALKDSVTDLSIHPNGDEIAISTYMQEHAIWVMENFLPEDHGK